MRKHAFFSILILLAASLAAPVWLEAQGQDPPPSGSGTASETPSLWPFQTQGSVSFGYRFADVTGYEPMYQELLNLQTGPRLTDFNIFSQATTPNPYVDNFSLTMSGLGGDPYPVAQLTVSKNNLYELHANWSQSYFDYAPDQNVILPGGVPGLTSEHSWSTVRKFGSFDFLLHASKNLRFVFDYYHTSNSGATFTPSAPDYLGAAFTSWGFYAEGSPFVLYAPLNDEANRFTGGLDYNIHSWTLHYRIGYQALTDDMTFNNPTSPQYSFETGNAFTVNTPVSLYSMSQYRHLTTPISEFSYTGKLTSKLELRGSYIFYDYSGPANMDEVIDGVRPTSRAATIFVPYSLEQQVRASVSEPYNIFAQGLTYKINPWWALNADYRYSRSTEDNIGVFAGVLDGNLLASNGTVPTMWRNGLSDLDFNMTFTPAPSLLFSPGITWDNANVESLVSGAAVPTQTLRWNTVEPSLSAFWQPISRLSLRGDIRTTDVGASYTAITPHTDTTGNIMVRLKLATNLSLDDTVNTVSSRLRASGFQERVRSNSTLLNYAYKDRLTFFGGLSYDSVIALGDIAFARGPAESLRDQEIDRVWQGGFQVNPGHHFGLRFTGNFDRSTGVGRISGNRPPSYGPETFPYATATGFYDFPKAGRLSVDLQRSYFIEQIVKANNFGAKVLMIRWTKNF